jgi:hypothetical protein
MDRHLTEVNGGETAQDDGCALDALIRFYRAFNAGDLKGLEQVWLGGSDPSMDNPIGGIRRGWDQIADGYSTLFKGKTKEYVRRRQRRLMSPSGRPGGLYARTAVGDSFTIMVPSRIRRCWLPIRN